MYIYVATSVMGYALPFRSLAGFSPDKQRCQAIRLVFSSCSLSLFSASPGHKASLVLIETL